MYSACSPYVIHFVLHDLRELEEGSPVTTLMLSSVQKSVCSNVCYDKNQLYTRSDWSSVEGYTTLSETGTELRSSSTWQRRAVVLTETK